MTHLDNLDDFFDNADDSNADWDDCDIWDDETDRFNHIMEYKNKKNEDDDGGNSKLDYEMLRHQVHSNWYYGKVKNSENMMKNLNKTGGLIFSQEVLLLLIKNILISLLN